MLLKRGWIKVPTGFAERLADCKFDKKNTGVWFSGTSHDLCLTPPGVETVNELLCYQKRSSARSLCISPIPAPAAKMAKLFGANDLSFSLTAAVLASGSTFITPWHLETGLAGGLATLVSDARHGLKLWQFCDWKVGLRFWLNKRQQKDTLAVPKSLRSRCMWALQRHGETILVPPGWFHRVFTISMEVADILAKRTALESLPDAIATAQIAVDQFKRSRPPVVSAVMLWGANWNAPSSLKKAFADSVALKAARASSKLSAASTAYTDFLGKTHKELLADVQRVSTVYNEAKKRKRRSACFGRKNKRHNNSKIRK